MGQATQQSLYSAHHYANGTNMTGTAQRRAMGHQMMQQQPPANAMQGEQPNLNQALENAERRPHALQAMQMDLMLMEQQNKQRLRLLGTPASNAMMPQEFTGERRPMAEHMMQLMLLERANKQRLQLLGTPVSDAMMPQPQQYQNPYQDHTVERRPMGMRMAQSAQTMLQPQQQYQNPYQDHTVERRPMDMQMMQSAQGPVVQPLQDYGNVRRTMAIQPAQLYSARSHYEGVVDNVSSQPIRPMPPPSHITSDSKLEQLGASHFRDWRELSNATTNQTSFGNQADHSDLISTTPTILATSSPYSTLPYTDSFRLLHIMPGFRFDPIVCELQTTRLEPANSHSEYPQGFEAISYVWGSEVDKQTITCNGKSVGITRNLHDALQRLRYEDQQRCIWADAVCVDQSNLDERSHQVRLMRSIYKTASRVVVWLGPDSSWDAFRAFTIVCSIANRHLRGKGGESQACFTYRGTSLLKNDEEPTFHSEEWTAVARLYDRDWFWRMWCVQEVALASDAVMMWGDDAEISWKWVGLAAARIRTNNYQVLQRHKMAGVFNAYLMYRISLNASDLPPMSLTIPFVRLLGLTRQFEAKDPRDRIFGLLGLPTNDSDPDNGRLYLQPDYNLSILETYRRLALKVFEKDRNCDILSSVQHGDTLDPSFPSWIPRWDKVHTLVICPPDPDPAFNACGSLPFPPKGYKGSSDTAEEGTEKQASKSDSDYLSLHGIIVDDVCRLTAVPPSNNPSDNTIMSRLGADFIRLQIRQDPKRLCWTLTAGKDWYGTPVADHAKHLADFKAALYSVLHPSEIDNALNDISTPHVYTNDADRYNQSASNACKARKLFFTKGGRIGLGPMAMQEGDLLSVLFGGKVPFVLRADEDSFRLVGECYVFDLMGGEAISLMQEDLKGMTLFNIV
jgi:hypothetical protein